MAATPTTTTTITTPITNDDSDVLTSIPREKSTPIDLNIWEIDMALLLIEWRKKHGHNYDRLYLSLPEQGGDLDKDLPIELGALVNELFSGWGYNPYRSTREIKLLGYNFQRPEFPVLERFDVPKRS